MKVNPINNNQTNFGALVKTSTSQDTINERMLIQEIKKCSQNCDFFKENNVEAYAKACCGNARVVLSYKPKAKNIKGFFKNLFLVSKSIVLHEYNWCTNDASYNLAKRIRTNCADEIKKVLK